MKKIFLKILLFIGLSSMMMPITIWDNITLDIPTPSWQKDLIIGSSSVSTERTELTDTINIINKYLWFSLAWIAMAIFVYAGLLLIIWWKKENFDKANKMLLWAGIAIVASMLSYTIIKLIINLF